MTMSKQKLAAVKKRLTFMPIWATMRIVRYNEI